MSILQTIQKHLPFPKKRTPQPTIADYGYHWLYPYLHNNTPPGEKNKQPTWTTYYKAMDNEWISACIDTYVVEALNAGFEIYSDNNKVDENPEVVEYVTDLFQRPDGPDGKDSYAKFMTRGITSMLGTGDFFAEVVTDPITQQLPTGFYFIQPHRLQYHYDTDQFGLIGTDIRYENDQLIHAEHGADPWNEIWGKSPIDKCARSITMDVLAGDFNKDFFKAKMDPRGAIEFDKDMPIDNVDNSINILKRQSKENPRGHLMLHGAKYMRITQSNRDLEFTSLLNMMRDRIISVYGVPPQNVGVYTSGSLGNERDNTADKKFKKRLQGKVFRPIEDEFNRVLGKSFDLFGWDERFYFGDIDLEDKLQRAQIENIRLRNGSLSVNEIRSGYGEEDVSWGDMPLSYVTPTNTYNTQSSSLSGEDNRLERVKSLLIQKGYIQSLDRV